MQVTVQYLAQLKRAAGCSSERVEAKESATLADILRLAAERHGAPLRDLLLDENSEPRRSLLFFIGDDHATPTRGVRDGDVVTILTPMAGG